MKNKKERLKIYRYLIDLILTEYLDNEIYLCYALRDIGVDIMLMEEICYFSSPDILCSWFYPVFTDDDVTYSNEQRLFALTMCVEMILNPISND